MKYKALFINESTHRKVKAKAAKLGMTLDEFILTVI